MAIHPRILAWRIPKTQEPGGLWSIGSRRVGHDWSYLACILIADTTSQVAQWQRTHCQCRWHGFDPWVGEIPWKRKKQPTPVFLPTESHRQRSLAGYSPEDHKELDITEHRYLVYIGRWINAYGCTKTPIHQVSLEYA